MARDACLSLPEDEESGKRAQSVLTAERNQEWSKNLNQTNGRRSLVAVTEKSSSAHVQFRFVSFRLTVIRLRTYIIAACRLAVRLCSCYLRSDS